MDIEKILQELTLEEKASLCAGSDAWHTQPIERLAIPAVMMADGPHGLRKEIAEGTGDILRDSYPATCFPTASALAASWNVDLIRRVGNAIAEECLAEGVSVVLGPGVNIKRSPLCGRNFEYFSEDPYLTGEMAVAFIQGVQEKGIGTSLKHFAANNQEYRRMLIDVVVDERALREIYLAGFETAIIKGAPWTVMAAYNKLNGTYCTEHLRLLDDILRDEWGFKGLVMSDWGAVNERVRGVAAGLDLEMPGIPNGNRALIVQAVLNRTLAEKELDAVVRRVLHLIEQCQSHPQEGFRYDDDAHHRLAQEAAAESAVLLKNEGNLLPLSKSTKIALIGQFAKNPRYQGSGSSLIHPTRMDTLYDAMMAFAGSENITYAAGYPLSSQEEDEDLLREAVAAAKTADAAVLCVGLTDLDEVESMDRAHLRLPAAHDRLIEAVAGVNPHTVVLLSNGSPVEMPWIQKVPSVLEGYLGGQAGAGAHCALLYGESNPSGKLAETFPLTLEDTPSYLQFPGGPKTVEYRESLYVGYRFYDTVGKKVLFPLGHGLSYSNFAYSDLKVNMNAVGADPAVTVAFMVKNDGKQAGKEIAQVYVHPKDASVDRPKKELKGFAKIDLKPGEMKEVFVALPRRAFSFYSAEKKDWVIETGNYSILVGASSRDIRLTADLKIEGEPKDLSHAASAFYSNFPADARVPQAEFAQLLDFPIPDNDADPKPYTLNTPLMDMQDALVGRILQRVMRKQLDNLIAEDMHGPTRLMIEQMAFESPLRVLVMFSGGALNRKTLEGLLLLANGKIIKGIRRLIQPREEG